MAVDGGKKL